MMSKDKTLNSKSVIGYFLGSIILTAVGCILIPPFIETCGNKVYKYSLKHDKIDYDNLGPKIVKKDITEGVI